MNGVRTRRLAAEPFGAGRGNAGKTFGQVGRRPQGEEESHGVLIIGLANGSWTDSLCRNNSSMHGACPAV